MRNGKYSQKLKKKKKKEKFGFDIWPLATVNESIQLMRYHCLIICIVVGMKFGEGLFCTPLRQSLQLLPTIHIHMVLEKVGIK